MLTAFKWVFLIFMILAVGHILGFFGSQGPVRVDRSVASALVLMLIFGLLLLHFSSFNALLVFMGNITNAVPFVSLISDWGTLRAGFVSAPLEAAQSFLDTVIMGFLVNIVQTLFGFEHIQGNKTFLYRLLLMVVIAGITLALLTVVQALPMYRWIVTFIGIIVTSLSVGSVLGAIGNFFVSLFRRPTAILGGFLAWLLFLTRLPVFRELRSSFYQALGFVLAILLVEYSCGSVAQAVALLSVAMTMAVPVLIMICGILYLICIPFR